MRVSAGSRGKLCGNLNILPLMRASTNCETRQQLKSFRNIDGNIVQHFPSEDNHEKYKTRRCSFMTITPAIGLSMPKGISRMHA